MSERELLDIVERELSRTLEEGDLKLKFHEIGIDSVKLIRIIVAIENQYNKGLTVLIDGDETFDNLEEFIEKVKNELTK